MKEAKNPGCLGRLIRFLVFTLILIVAMVYFFCWWTPAFKLTPQRVGWEIPAGAEVPMTADGKYVDHAQLFEMQHPEIYANPQKNGWRKVLLAAGPKWLKEEWAIYLQNHLRQEPFAILVVDWAPTQMVTETLRQEAAQNPEVARRWEAMWALYCQRMDISPAEAGACEYEGPVRVMEKTARDSLVALAKDYAEKHPELADDPRDAFEHEDFRILGSSEYDEPGAAVMEMLVPCHDREHHETDVQTRLREKNWTAAEFPRVAQWVAENSALLDTVEEVVREDFYCPILSREDTHHPLLEGCYPLGIMLHNRIRVGLSVRCAMCFGEGDTRGAVRDLETLILLGGHLEKACFFEFYGSTAEINQAAAKLVLNNLESPGIPPEAMKTLLARWNLPSPVTVKDMVAYTKMQYLDACQRKLPLLEEITPRFAFLPYDQNLALDELTAYFRWAEALNSLEKLGEGRQKSEQPSAAKVLLTQMFTHSRTKFLVEEIQSDVYWTAHYLGKGTAGDNDRALARAALAAALYHAEKGEFPETLDAMVPEYLAVVPGDAYRTGEKIKYRVEADAVEISAAGPGEDLVVRLRK